MVLRARVVRCVIYDRSDAGTAPHDKCHLNVSLRCLDPAAYTATSRACCCAHMSLAACSMTRIMREQHLMTCFPSTQVAFIIGQSFLSTLCGMCWGTFVFYAAFLALGVVFAILFIPETKVSRAMLLLYTLITQ